jgi:hypothetical protein
MSSGPPSRGHRSRHIRRISCPRPLGAPPAVSLRASLRCRRQSAPFQRVVDETVAAAWCSTASTNAGCTFVSVTQRRDASRRTFTRRKERRNCATTAATPPATAAIAHSGSNGGTHRNTSRSANTTAEQVPTSLVRIRRSSRSAAAADQGRRTVSTSRRDVIARMTRTIQPRGPRKMRSHAAPSPPPYWSIRKVPSAGAPVIAHTAGRRPRTASSTNTSTDAIDQPPHEAAPWMRSLDTLSAPAPTVKRLRATPG